MKPIYALLFLLPVLVNAQDCNEVKLSRKALAIIKPLMELRIKQNTDQFTEDGRWIGESQHTPKVHEQFYAVLENKSPEGDEALVYLLNVYMGSHPGEELVCEATNRGKKLLPLIHKYQRCMPQIGLEPLPKFIQGSGFLPKFAIEGINNGEACVYH